MRLAAGLHGSLTFPCIGAIERHADKRAAASLIGRNMSAITRRVLYYRLLREGHRDRWRDCMLDPMLEFDAVRSVIE